MKEVAKALIFEAQSKAKKILAKKVAMVHKQTDKKIKEVNSEEESKTRAAIDLLAEKIHNSEKTAEEKLMKDEAKLQGLAEKAKKDSAERIEQTEKEADDIVSRAKKASA